MAQRTTSWGMNGKTMTGMASRRDVLYCVEKGPAIFHLLTVSLDGLCLDNLLLVDETVTMLW